MTCALPGAGLPAPRRRCHFTDPACRRSRPLELGLALEGTSLEHLVPTEVLERGVDFVRYACRRA